MAIRTLKKGSLTSASKTTVLAIGVGTVATISNAVLCNTSGSQVDVTIWLADDGGSETMLTTVRVPAGIGRSKIVPELIGGINANYSIKMQPSTAGVDYTLYGFLSAG